MKIGSDLVSRKKCVGRKNENMLAFISILHAEETIFTHLILDTVWNTAWGSRLHFVPKTGVNSQKNVRQQMTFPPPPLLVHTSCNKKVSQFLFLSKSQQIFCTQRILLLEELSYKRKQTFMGYSLTQLFSIAGIWLLREMLVSPFFASQIYSIHSSVIYFSPFRLPGSH